MTEVFVVLVEDNHCDVDAEVFTNEVDAVKWAINQVPDLCDPVEDVYEEDAQLTEGMKRDGWVLYLPYSEEDCVRVMRRELK